MKWELEAASDIPGLDKVVRMDKVVAPRTHSLFLYTGARINH